MAGPGWGERPAVVRRCVPSYYAPLREKLRLIRCSAERHRAFPHVTPQVRSSCGRANTLGIPLPGWLRTAIPQLQNALASHWNGQYYRTLLPVPTDPSRAPYDPNSDIVSAAIYGAVPVTDTKLLATAALLRSQWADRNSPNFYPVNGADQQLSSGPVGPLLGRYPGDTYDGDTADQPARDHPWALTTANFAERYYRLAREVTSTGTVPLDSLSAAFFSQIEVGALDHAQGRVGKPGEPWRPDAAGAPLP